MKRIPHFVLSLLLGTSAMSKAAEASKGPPGLTHEAQTSSDAPLEYAIGKGRIYAVPATKIPDYLRRVIDLLAKVSQSQKSPLHGFDGKDDGHLTTEFPTGRLVFDERTLETTVVPSEPAK